MTILHKQQGVTLVISLIMLVMLTLVVIGSINMSTSQEKVAYNVQDKEISFQMAESGIREAEQFIQGLTAQPTPRASCTNSACVLNLNVAASPEVNSSAWWQTNGTQYAGTIAGANNAPYYIVQFLRFVPDTPTLGDTPKTGVYYYRITARGTGATDQAVSVIQTTFSARF